MATASPVSWARSSTSRSEKATGSPSATGSPARAPWTTTDDALGVHPRHHADEAGPRHAREGNRAVLLHEENDLVAVEEIAGLEVERARDEGVPVRGGLAVEGEARAPDERRVLQLQRDVVERVEEHHALVARHPVGERVRLQGERLGSDFPTTCLGHPSIDVHEAETAVVHDSDARDPPRDVALELPP